MGTRHLKILEPKHKTDSWDYRGNKHKLVTSYMNCKQRKNRPYEELGERLWNGIKDGLDLMSVNFEVPPPKWGELDDILNLFDKGFERFQNNESFRTRSNCEINEKKYAHHV